jgi:hypothetical protein
VPLSARLLADSARYGIAAVNVLTDAAGGGLRITVTAAQRLEA